MNLRQLGKTPNNLSEISALKERARQALRGTCTALLLVSSALPAAASSLDMYNDTPHSNPEALSTLKETQLVAIDEVQKEDSHTVQFRVRAIPQQNGSITSYFANGLTEKGILYRLGLTQNKTASGRYQFNPTIQMCDENGILFAPPEFKGSKPTENPTFTMTKPYIATNDLVSISLSIGHGLTRFTIVDETRRTRSEVKIASSGSIFLGASSEAAKIRSLTRMTFSGISLEQYKPENLAVNIADVNFNMDRRQHNVPYGFFVFANSENGLLSSGGGLSNNLASQISKAPGIVNVMEALNGRGLRLTDSSAKPVMSMDIGATVFTSMKYSIKRNTSTLTLGLITEVPVKLLIAGQIRK